MPINPNLPAILPADLGDARTFLENVEALFPFLLNLSLKEKRRHPTLKNKRETFTTKIYTHATANNSIVPSFVSLSNLDRRLSNHKQLKTLENMLLVLLEKVRDTSHNEGHLAYKEAIRIRDMIMIARDSEVPGIDTIYEDVKSTMPKMGRPSANPG